MKFVKDSFEHSKGRHIRMVACTKSGVEDWFITVGLVVYRLIGFVESSIKKTFMFICPFPWNVFM